MHKNGLRNPFVTLIATLACLQLQACQHACAVWTGEFVQACLLLISVLVERSVNRAIFNISTERPELRNIGIKYGIMEVFCQLTAVTVSATSFIVHLLYIREWFLRSASATVICSNSKRLSITIEHCSSSLQWFVKLVHWQFPWPVRSACPDRFAAERRPRGHRYPQPAVERHSARSLDTPASASRIVCHSGSTLLCLCLRPASLDQPETTPKYHRLIQNFANTKAMVQMNEAFLDLWKE